VIKHMYFWPRISGGIGIATLYGGFSLQMSGKFLAACQLNEADS
jgi:hypothetical protein